MPRPVRKVTISRTSGNRPTRYPMDQTKMSDPFFEALGHFGKPGSPSFTMHELKKAGLERDPATGEFTKEYIKATLEFATSMPVIKESAEYAAWIAKGDGHEILSPNDPPANIKDRPPTPYYPPNYDPFQLTCSGPNHTSHDEAEKEIEPSTQYNRPSTPYYPPMDDPLESDGSGPINDHAFNSDGSGPSNYRDYILESAEAMGLKRPSTPYYPTDDDSWAFTCPDDGEPSFRSPGFDSTFETIHDSRNEGYDQTFSTSLGSPFVGESGGNYNAGHPATPPSPTPGYDPKNPASSWSTPAPRVRMSEVEYWFLVGLLDRVYKDIMSTGKCDGRSIDIITGVRTVFIRDYTELAFRTAAFAGTIIKQLMESFPRLVHIKVRTKRLEMPTYDIWRVRKRSKGAGQTWIAQTNLTRRIDQLGNPPRAPFVMPEAVQVIWRYCFFANHYIGTPPPTVTALSPPGDQICSFISDTTMSFGFTYAQLWRCTQRRRCPRRFRWGSVIIKLPHYTIDQLNLILDLLQPDHIQVDSLEIHMTRPEPHGIYTWDLLTGGPELWEKFRKFKRVELHLRHAIAHFNQGFRNALVDVLEFARLEPLGLDRMVINIQPSQLLHGADWTNKTIEDFGETYLLFTYAMQEIVGGSLLDSRLYNRGVDIAPFALTNLLWWFATQLPLRSEDPEMRRAYLDVLAYDRTSEGLSSLVRVPSPTFAKLPPGKVPKIVNAQCDSAKPKITDDEFGEIKILYDASKDDPEVSPVPTSSREPVPPTDVTRDALVAKCAALKEGRKKKPKKK